MPARKRPGGGLKQEKIWRDAIMRAVNRRDQGKKGTKYLEKCADELVKIAAAGDVAALKEIGDRLDGRALQSMELHQKVTLIDILTNWDGTADDGTVAPESEDLRDRSPEGHA